MCSKRWLLLCVLTVGGCSKNEPEVGAGAVTGESTRTGEGARAGAARPASGDDGADGLLSLDRIHTIHLELDPAAMAALDDEPRKYVEGSFRHAGNTLDHVGIRFKGHRTLRDWHGKPSFKVSFTRHDKQRRYMGLRQLMLHNGVEDPTMLREALGNYVVRELGVPAPRKGFAQVYVNGELFGLYTSSEAADRDFLSRHFRDGSGPLYEGAYSCDVLPGDVLSMEHDRGDDPKRMHIRALAEAAQGPVDAWLHPEKGPMDREAFLRFLAVDTLIGDFDGYRHGHNYLLYREPTAQRWYMMPWGLDRVLRSRMKPYDHHAHLSTACLADARCRLDYVKALHAAIDAFEALPLRARMDQIDRLIADARKADPRDSTGSKARAKQLDRTAKFLAERAAELREQLACWNGSEEVDADGDGHGCMDCDDGNAAIHPGARDVCGDGIDNDCSGVEDDDPACPCSDQELEGGRFSLCNKPMSWWKAARFCEARGQQLARIDSSAQSRALGKAADALEDAHWWVGLQDHVTEGKPRWQDGSEPTFERWAGGEPDDYACGQDCGALKKGGSGRWRDLHCSHVLPFICRKPKD